MMEMEAKLNLAKDNDVLSDQLMLISLHVLVREGHQQERCIP